MEILIISGVAVLLVAVTLAVLLSRYRRCASDQILVVFGKSGKTKVVNENGKSETKMLPSKVIHGGGAFVWPIIQDYKFMTLTPIQIQEVIDGRSKENIQVRIPITLTTCIGTTTELMQNAATRVLSLDLAQQRDILKDILVGEVRSLIANLTVIELKENRDKFLGDAKSQIDPELNKFGFSIMNINSSDVKDDSQILDSLSKKAATLAKATAEADIAEQEKIGAIKVANTSKERAIAIAEAQKEQATTVAKTSQEEEVRVAQINQEKEVQLAETEKTRETEIATRRAEQAANVAKSEAAAESARAEAEAVKVKNIAKAENDAAAQKAEFEANKRVRMAQADAKQKTEEQRAIQEQEASIALYESEKRKKKAEADKAAGVAEQLSTMEVSKARGEAGKAQVDASREIEMAKVEAEMQISKTAQERQLEVNEARAKAEAAKLKAETVIPAEKAKEVATIQAEAQKNVQVIAAEAEAAKVLKEAQAQAEAIRLKAEAEAEGNRKKLLADAEGKKASLMAETDAEVLKAQGIAAADAVAIERLLAAGLTPEAAVQIQIKDVTKAIGMAEADAKILSNAISGQVTVYGNTETAGSLAGNLLQLVPAVKQACHFMREGVSEVKGAFRAEPAPAAIEAGDASDKKENDPKFEPVK